jgi:hypothetical protein
MGTGAIIGGRFSTTLWLFVRLLGMVFLLSFGACLQGGSLDRVHRAHGDIYRFIIEERSEDGQARRHLNWKGLSTSPRWKSYLQELPRGSWAEIQTASLDNRLAYWLNLRNAALMKGLSETLRTSVVERLEDIPDWKGFKIEASGRVFTVGEVEQYLIEIEEPLALFGLSEGTVASPPWPISPYTTGGVYDRLLEQGRFWLLDPNIYRLDQQKNELYLSEWFRGRLGFLRSAENALILGQRPSRYSTDHSLILGALHGVLRETDRQYIWSKKPAIRWIEASDTLLLMGR